MELEYLLKEMIEEIWQELLGMEITEFLREKPYMKERKREITETVTNPENLHEWSTLS